MKNNYTVYTFLLGFFYMMTCYAGNPDRAGQGGASELLINPWARSSGWAAANVAGTRGLESMFINVAGTAFTRKTEIILARSQYLKGTGININAAGITQHIGETGALSAGLMAMDFGDIPITTVESPEGNMGTYAPQFLNLGIAYAKGFSDDIYAGAMIKIITEKTANISARGIALDAGIQYVTGKYDQIKFGIAFKNWGPRMKFSGNGLSFKTPIPAATNGSSTMTVEQRAAQYELPTLLNMGMGYDFYLSRDSIKMKQNRITVMAAFTSHSFQKDQFKLGLEYGWKNILMIRAGYALEKGLFSVIERTNVYTGPCAGFTLEIPFGKNKSTFGIDYSYTASNPFGGTHSIGVRINL